MNSLILVRHGQSIWNREKRFTGWADVELTEKGKSEANRAGELLKNMGISRCKFGEEVLMLLHLQWINHILIKVKLTQLSHKNL